MSQLPVAHMGLEPTILWLGARRTKHSAIMMQKTFGDKYLPVGLKLYLRQTQWDPGI